MEERFKCKYCTKDFKSEIGRGKHEAQYCMSNPNSTAFIRDSEHVKNLEKAVEEINQPIEETPTSEEVETIQPIEEEIAVEEEEINQPIEEKTEYSEFETSVIKFMSNKRLNNIVIKGDEKQEMLNMFLTIFNKPPYNVNCVGQTVNAFTSIWFWMQTMIKNK